MGGRAPVERARKADAEDAAAELAEHYARILGRQADRQVVDVVRVCLRRLPSRLPIHGEDLRAVEVLLERVLRLGEVGARDPFGSPRQIDDYIARQLGTAACGPRFVYRALRAMLGRTALVERHSRQIWSLRLLGLTDPSSAIHRALLAETPAPYALPRPETDGAAAFAASGETTPREASSTDQLREELARLHEQVAVERATRLAAEELRAAAVDELGRARRTLDEVRPAIARHAELEDEIRGLRKALEEERGARYKLSLVHATQRTELENEYRPLRHALEEERQARDEAEARVQSVTAQLIEAKEKNNAALREHDAQLQSMQAETVRLTRGAQVADATHVWRLIEAGRAKDALTFIAARMQGLDVAVDDELPRSLLASAVPNPTAESPPPGTASSAATANASPPAIHEQAATPRRSATVPPTSPARSMAFEVDPDQHRRAPLQRTSKVGRNEPCPCGSGNKYKRCCGRSGGSATWTGS